MYEDTGPQFFRTTPGRQSRLEAFDESMFFLLFWELHEYHAVPN